MTINQLLDKDGIFIENMWKYLISITEFLEEDKADENENYNVKDDLKYVLNGVIDNENDDSKDINEIQKF